MKTKSLLIDCSTGISGDMLLSAFLSLGLPLEKLHQQLKNIGLGHSFDFDLQDIKSYGLGGFKIKIERKKSYSSCKKWSEIKSFLYDSFENNSLRKNILRVFNELAIAESSVHQCDISNVHFHELSSIETLINIVGVCTAIDYFEPGDIFFTPPPACRGSIKTSHGLIPLPAPTVLEMARKNKIALTGKHILDNIELTTPTGIALLSVFINNFSEPGIMNILSTGVGIGSKDLGFPNILRLILFDDTKKNLSGNSFKTTEVGFEELLIQESWVDDATPEDIADFANQLRNAGALEAVIYPVQMKKSRQGFAIKALVRNDLAEKLRSIWFKKGTTLGLREYFAGRWTLPRRVGSCMILDKKIKAKQIKKTDGSVSTKIEHNELLIISRETGKSIEEVRQLLYSNELNFVPEGDWFF